MLLFLTGGTLSGFELGLEGLEFGLPVRGQEGVVLVGFLRVEGEVPAGGGGYCWVKAWVSALKRRGGFEDGACSCHGVAGGEGLWSVFGGAGGGAREAG